MIPGIRLRGRVGSEIVMGIAESPGAAVQEVTDHLAPAPQLTGRVFGWEQVRVLAPLVPRTIIAFAKNYADHAREMGGEPPAEPVIFLKPPSAVIGPGDRIELPSASQTVHHEAEVAVVIGAVGRDLTPAQADGVVLGYTCANDVSARDLQARDGQWGRAKGFDTFCPLGPWIAELPGLAAHPVDRSYAVTCSVNAVVRQQGSTADMIYSVAELVAWTSSVLTLQPGDVILTGTPAGVGPLREGDDVAVTVERLGTLSNGVVNRG